MINKRISFSHQPVMVSEVLKYSSPSMTSLGSLKDVVFVDGTLGGGGHAKALLSQFKIRLIGIDQDLEAIFAAKKNLAEFADQVIFVHDNFSNLPAILESQGIDKVDGILLDLGVSSYQFDNPSRGFSFQKNGPLDMRMNQEDEKTAGDIINFYDEKELSDIFYKFGEERYSRQIARNIIKSRPIATTSQLVEVIKKSTPPKYRFGSKIHFATRVFQALRIEVNNELKVLKDFIPKAAEFLAGDGRLVIISFHSLEDRIVKHNFRELAKNNNEKFKVITKKPITASEEEITANPRARSAKMRVLERI